MEIRKVKISPQVLKFDLSAITYDSKLVGYYPPLSQLLISGTRRVAGLIPNSPTPISIFTDLSIPILLTQDYQDIGYYSPFDGFLSHTNEEINFTFQKGSGSKDICVYNTSNNKLKYIKNTVFQIDWGDNTVENFTEKFPNSKCHTYSVNGDYIISLSGLNKIGIFKITKKIKIPYNLVSYSNQYGTVTFNNLQGSWSNTPTTQSYVYPYDSGNTISDQIYFQNVFTNSNILPIPFTISGYTKSRLSELYIYGPNKLGSPSAYPTIKLKDGTTGKTLSVSSSYTSYTMNMMTYYDYPDGKSIFVVQSYGITSDMIVQSAITKFDYLLNIINDTEIQSNVFIERGKNSGTENFRRIGEVESTGELDTYGYNFFDVRFFNDI